LMDELDRLGFLGAHLSAGVREVKEPEETLAVGLQAA
jgi:hypothetical protein